MCAITVRSLVKMWRRSRTARRSNRLASVEGLEPRVLPAIVAVVSSGELRLTGDVNPNDVLVQKSGSAVQVVGRNGTTIRIGSTVSASADFSGVTSLRATFKGSNDSIQIGDGLNFKNVTLTLGAGLNHVTIGASQITAKLTVTGGAGADTVQLTQTVLANATLTTSSGDDRITFGAVTANGTVTVNTGNGADIFETILVTPPGGSSGGGGIGGLGGVGDLSQLSTLTRFLQTESQSNLGDFVDLQDLQDFVDTNGDVDLSAIRQLAALGDLDQILNPNGTLNLLNFLNLGNVIDLSSVNTGELQDLTQIVDLSNLTSQQQVLLQQLIDYASAFGLENVINSDDLLDPAQPDGLGSSLTGVLNIVTGNGDDVVSLSNARIGSVSVTAGNDRDQVLLDTIALDKTLKINGGSGDDQIRLNGVQQSGPGSNLIDGSTGVDVVSVAASLFTSGVTLGGGTTTGNQILIDDVMFQSFVTVNALGAGDLVKIEQDPLHSGSTVFSQAVKINLGGAGQTTVSQNQPTTETRFLSTASVTGKTPRGRLIVAASHTQFASAVALKNVDYSVI